MNFVKIITIDIIIILIYGVNYHFYCDFFLMDFITPFIIFIITITMIIVIIQIYSNHLYLILFLGILKRERRCMIWQFKIYIEVFSDNRNNGPHGML